MAAVANQQVLQELRRVSIRADAYHASNRKRFTNIHNTFERLEARIAELEKELARQIENKAAPPPPGELPVPVIPPRRRSSKP